ncbi:MAG: DegT/DnrJ/EryC1/StrS family aminotransferase [Acidobacteria bacterium]|nr:DegT/DnrJ/EryC1/StrS family aminotransferase [Acidobacteriota bacterium]
MPPNTAPFNDFARQWEDVRADALRVVDEVGRSGWYILGDRVRRFEQALASYWGFSEAVGVASGLDAIEIALRAAGLRPGEKVLTTPLSAFASTLAIIRAGGIPVFCDTTEIGLIDLNEARAALRAMPEIRFLLPVHLYGFPLDSESLRALIGEFRLVCVEDCAQSIGATENGRPTGTVGIAAATSFYPTKNLGTMGDGGAVLTSDPVLAARARCLRDYGQTEKYRHTEIGCNSRLDELHAALLRDVFLPRLAAWTERRCDIAARYLSNWPSAAVRPIAANQPTSGEWRPCWHLFPTRVSHEKKPLLITHLRRQGIQPAEHYPCLIPDQTAMSGISYACFGPLKQAKRLAAEELSLPIHPYLSDGDTDAVLRAIADFSA